MENNDNEVKEAIASLHRRLNTLGDMSEALCQEHFDLVKTGNKSRSWDDKSKLFVQARKRGYGLTVNWYEIRWYGSKAAKTRRMDKKLIVKPKDKYGYSLDTLLKLSQAWEAEMVRYVELELATIRYEVVFISKALQTLNHLVRDK